MMHSGIQLDDDFKKRIENLLTGTQTISQFIYNSTLEKVNRMEVRDKQTRLDLHHKDVVLLEPVILDVLKMHGLMK